MSLLGTGSLGPNNGQASDPITMPSGTTFLLVQVAYDNSAVTPGAAIGGNAMTQRASNDWYYNTRRHALFWYPNPPSGTPTLAASGAGVIRVTWYARDDIDTTVPFVGSDTYQETDEVTTNPSATVSSATDEVVVMAVVGLDSAGGQTGIAAAGDSTLQLNTFQSGETSGFIDEVGAASVTINGARAGTAGIWSFGSNVMRLKLASSLDVQQEGFRWRNDDGSESTATWKAAQDTNVNMPIDGAARLRILLNATGDAPSAQYQLEYRIKTSGTWRKVEI